MKLFLSIKYYDDMRNRALIEQICEILESNKIDVFAFARNIQNYEETKLTANEIMNIAFNEIKSSDILMIEASEISIGAGIEAGYAYALGIPVYLIASKSSEVSNSIKGISKKSIFYEDPKEILDLFAF